VRIFIVGTTLELREINHELFGFLCPRSHIQRWRIVPSHRWGHIKLQPVNKDGSVQAGNDGAADYYLTYDKVVRYGKLVEIKEIGHVWR
jgi:hypothetical protein